MLFFFYLAVSEENAIICDASGEDTANIDNETEQRGKINTLYFILIHFYMSLKVDNNYIRLFNFLSFQVMRVLLHLKQLMKCPSHVSPPLIQKALITVSI